MSSVVLILKTFVHGFPFYYWGKYLNKWSITSYICYILV